MSGAVQMNPELMKPFVQGTVEVFESLLKVRLRESPLEIKNAPEGTFDLSAVVGLSGSATGNFVLSAPQETARRIVSRLLQDEDPVSEQDMIDGIGEVLNIAAGRACQKLGVSGLDPLYLSPPAAVIGPHRIVWPTKDLPCLLMRFFDSELGPFSIEVSMQCATGSSSMIPRRNP